MPRGPKWTADENDFLTGILRAHGDQPRRWPTDVRNMVKARLAERTESGIYQQTLKILKARAVDTPSTEILHLSTGA